MQLAMKLNQNYYQRVVMMYVMQHSQITMSKMTRLQLSVAKSRQRKKP